MPTTRAQAHKEDKKRRREAFVGDKHDTEAQPAPKRKRNSKITKKSKSRSAEKEVTFAKDVASESPWTPGTIERGHIYFFYRPKVEKNQVDSLDDVRSFQILLTPRPPGFAVHDTTQATADDNDAEMTVLEKGEDAVPAKEPVGVSRKRFRLILVGKKKLPDPDHVGSGGGRRKENFWATVTKVGDDLDSLERGLGPSSYETKTRGTRHEAPVRLVGRGAYAIVNNDPRVPSERETHLGYRLSHPKELGDVHHELGVHIASSFVLQIKNPLAPSTGAMMQSGGGKGADYSPTIMDTVFGKGSKGRQSYGLRFTSCSTTDLLDAEGAQLLLIAARQGEEGLETSLGEGRGDKLDEVGKKESQEPITKAFRELRLDEEIFPAGAIKGEWI